MCQSILTRSRLLDEDVESETASMTADTPATLAATPWPKPGSFAYRVWDHVGRVSGGWVQRPFAREMLLDIGVAATPGVDFDAERGGRYLRFSYAGATADMADAVRRLKTWRGLKSRA